MDVFIPISRFLGLAGALYVTLAVIYSALAYRGRQGQPFSPVNHFISELGEEEISIRSGIFNSGLIIGGIFMMPFLIGLGLQIGGGWAALATLAGLVAAVSLALVGVYPMNHLDPHVKSATTYFRSGLVMVILFGLAILRQPANREAIPVSAALVSLIPVAAYSVFLLFLRVKTTGQGPANAFDPNKITNRPRFWLLPFLEWLVFFSTLVWIGGIALI